MIDLKNRNYNEISTEIVKADINTLFAQAVLNGMVKGKIYADNEETPRTLYIKHPYGMSLLFGTTEDETFYKELTAYMLNTEHKRNNFEWLQIYPESNSSKIDTLIGNYIIKMNPNEPYIVNYGEENRKILEFQRINFKFNQIKFLAARNEFYSNLHNIVITSETIYEQMTGSVLPKYFWNSYHEFISNGIGFTLLSEEGIPLSTAFASFVIGDKLEIGIETHQSSRGSGYATAACAKLIEYCMEHSLEPVWSCNSGNLGSRRLADKLGFEEVIRIPYYRLPY